MLKRQFAQIEVLLMLHPKDKNIREAATALVVDILEAIEEGIAFFVKPRRKLPPLVSPAPDLGVLGYFKREPKTSNGGTTHGC